VPGVIHRTPDKLDNSRGEATQGSFNPVVATRRFADFLSGCRVRRVRRWGRIRTISLGKRCSLAGRGRGTFAIRRREGSSSPVRQPGRRPRARTGPGRRRGPESLGRREFYLCQLRPEGFEPPTVGSEDGHLGPPERVVDFGVAATRRCVRHSHAMLCFTAFFNGFHPIL